MPDAKPGDADAASQRRTTLQQALAAIERLQVRVDAAENARHEPIAVVGMGCRLPGGVADPDDFWRLLTEGRDAIGEVPPSRWDADAYYDPAPGAVGKAYTKAGGFVSRVEDFEPGFFGMSPREAASVDPQQRLLLEVGWEALEHAAIPADSLDGSRTGVFVGITSSDYSQRIDLGDPERSDIYLATGTALNVAAGRLSYTFGFRGPCMAIDTACSSSLVAIHAACQSLRNRESDLTLAGGVNVMLSPDAFVLIAKWGMLSPEGRCKTFDAAADGFVRGEGCGIVVLERYSDAVANGRRILAVIPGSAINQDGRSSGLTVPNGLAQQEVIRQALAASRLKPGDVSYVEAHGTATSLGDPIEVEALAAVYGEGRPMDQPFEVGSVKSNIGHLESASGVVSVIKLVLALQHRQIPASLHVKTLNPAIPWDAIPVRVSTSLHRWEPPDGRRVAGVSAFGFSGMNAHLLIQEAPARPASPAEQPEHALHLLPLSAKRTAALPRVAGLHADYFEAHPEQRLSEICATAAQGRAHLNARILIAAPDRAAMVSQLRREAAGEGHAPRGLVVPGSRIKVAFLFSGQGSQHAGMGRALDRSGPAFRATLDRCAAVLDPLIGRSIRDLMFEDPAGELDQTGFTQPALYALEVSLAALWRSWGIEPAVVLGHSVGEFAAAAVAGVVGIEDGARLIAERARLMQSLPAGGVMISVYGDLATIERAVASADDRVSIAAINAPDTVVIAGEAAAIRAIVARLESHGMRTQALKVSHAFHSPLMDPIVEAFRRFSASIPHAPPAVTWISNLTGSPIDWATWGARMGDYWAMHLRQPVLFARGMASLDAAACDAHVEIGPGQVLLDLGRQSLTGREIEWLPTLRRRSPDLEAITGSVGRLHVRGASLNWAAIQGASVARSVQLPTYPFERQPYFMPFEPKSSRRVPAGEHALLGEPRAIAGLGTVFEITVDDHHPDWLADHRVAGSVVMPFTAYLEAMLAAIRRVEGNGLATLEDVTVSEALVLRDGERRIMQVIVDRPGDASHRIRILSRPAQGSDPSWTLHASASVSAAVAASAQVPPLSVDASGLDREVDVEAFYEKLRQIGADFGPQFRAMTNVRCGAGQAIGRIALRDGLRDARGYLLHPASLDASLHVCAAAIDGLFGAGEGRFYLPVGVDRYSWASRPDGPLQVHATVRMAAAGDVGLTLDVGIQSLDGRAVARLDGLRCRPAGPDMFRQRDEARIAQWLYEVKWAPQPLAAPYEDAAGRCWLILDDGEPYGADLAREIAARGGVVVRGLPRSEAPGDVAIDPDLPGDYDLALESAGRIGGVAGVVCLWPRRIPVAGEADAPGAIQRFGHDAVLHLLHALTRRAEPAPPRVWIVTAGSQAVDGTEEIRVEQSPVASLARVADSEHPELRVTSVDLDPNPTRADAKLLTDELLSDSDEHQVAFRKGARWVARLKRLHQRARPAGDRGAVRLDIAQRGTLENLAIVPMTRRHPGPGEVELRVHASGLNFRDVLSALDLYPGSIRYLGSDCAGRVTALGEGVTGFSVGDRVVAMAEGALASHAVTRSEFVAPLPRSLTFEQGAAIPTPYLTAEITLRTIAGMKRGDRVLIHSGAGGVGMAAIALALQTGAEIFATAGGEEKRAVLRRMGVLHALDSRSASFADDIARITGGEGVQIVLNSLAGPLLDRTFECVANGGIFLEIGKRGIWSHERVNALGRGIRYHVVDGSEIAGEDPALVGRIFARVLNDIAVGSLRPLPHTTFRFDDAASGFRFMAQAKHIGRIVFRHDAEPIGGDVSIRADVTYLITGGLRGLGLRAGEWLVSQGARTLVLAGRREPDAEGRAILERMEREGAQILRLSADVATPDGVDLMMAALDGLPPLGGVIHCAAVLDDGVLAMQSPERFARVMAPKADGAWRLHVAIGRRADRPDFFVLFSSVASIFGAAGQGNYVAANAFLDALAHHRRASGLPAVSINWGAWSGDGMAVRGDVLSRSGAQGISALSIRDGMEALRVVLREDVAQASVIPIDWRMLGAQFGAAGPPALIRALVEGARTTVRALRVTDDPRLDGDLGALASAERHNRLVVIVRRELATVLAMGGSAEPIADDQPFTDLGLDSLTAVELRNRLQASLGRGVPAMAAFDWPTVSEMARHLNGLFGDAAADARPRLSAEETRREEFTL